jgi:hypothetical protein
LSAALLAIPIGSALAGNDSSASPAERIVYLNAELDYAMVFEEGRAQIGPAALLALAPGKGLSTVESNKGGVQCLSVGPAGATVDFAIKRPLKSGARFECGRTQFRVTNCFADCRAAIIEADRPLSGARPGTYVDHLYVDSCRGVIAAGGVGDWAHSIPFSAALLRGKVGILANSDFPKCSSF